MELAANLWRYLVRYGGWIALSVAAIVSYAATTLVIVALIEPMISEVMPAGTAIPAVSSLVPGGAVDTPDAAPGFFDLRGRLRLLYDALKDFLGISPAGAVFFAPIVFFLVFAFRSLSSFLSRYAFQHAGLGVTTDLRNDLCEHILRQSDRFHAEHSSGELYSRVVSDVDKMQSAVSGNLIEIPKQGLTILALVWLLLSTHLPLALVCLMAVPMILFLLVRFGKGMRSGSFRSQERMADLSGLLAEAIRGHRIVKAFGMEDFELGRFKEATAKHLKVNLRMQIVSSYSSPVIESVGAAGSCALIIVCSYLVRSGELSGPLVVQFLANLLLLYDPVRRMNRVNLVLQAALAPARRVFDMLALGSDIEEPDDPAPLRDLHTSIVLDRVSFGYRDAYVLDDFSLEIRRGQRVALVGASGAGKSTVANLLPRFFDPDRGKVLIDGVDISTVSLQDLRALIGLVPQETTLFDDTVRNNIAYGRDEVGLDVVRAAAAASYADDFIMLLPEGYDTMVGESGKRLSGGQRQRLSIARALLKDAPILILDEATSQLDTESEVAVQKALDNLMQDRTTLVIAHRLSTVMSADAIIVMAAGRIVESGTHAELLALGGSYRRLYDLQFRD